MRGEVVCESVVWDRGQKISRIKQIRDQKIFFGITFSRIKNIGLDKEGRKDGGKEGRKEGREGGRKEGRKH